MQTSETSRKTQQRKHYCVGVAPHVRDTLTNALEIRRLLFKGLIDCIREISSVPQEPNRLPYEVRNFDQRN